MKPDSDSHNPNPDYLRNLIVEGGLSIRATAKLLGISSNGLFNYLRDELDPLYRKAPYTVQFALESLAGVAASANDFKETD
ncbi:phage antirepressor KilAC domain-containing protein [Pseudomonas syringae pv. syringae]|uniref:phage antirepressor KilAC domain-containing protein n=1 Tax=Pseudomonas syringae TaxID=317 RepID=UPI00200B4D8A|nr:phage antirepressor KilAC domain-containing protein [Pseudomonas syringae]MCK9759834.1 phage antirepressor KilAC domain-containing protein [Pseudomonas syringae pv. syringae]MCK9774825.1 phage antirepressor KilAC domain-containing protein [Pseudomonas syringae pv. syringae]